MKSTRKALRRQFTIGIVLFLICLVAGLLSGYRKGYQYGVEAMSNGPFVVTYDVRSLIASNEDVDGLLDLITTNIAPESWDHNGGKASIQYFPMNKSLIVNQENEPHTEISRLLSHLRVTTLIEQPDNTADGSPVDEP